MKSFNDFLVNDGVCSVQVVAGFVRIIKRGGSVDTIAASVARPRDISDLLVSWSFISDFVECVEFVSQGVGVPSCLVLSGVGLRPSPVLYRLFYPLILR